MTKIPQSNISAGDLPDSDLKNIMLVSSNALDVKPSRGLVQLALYSEVSRQARNQCTGNVEITKQVSDNMIESMLKRCRTYTKAQNVLARIFGWITKETDFQKMQNVA